MRDFTIARYGDMHTVAVLVAQRLLRSNREPADKLDLKVDGEFGDSTRRALHTFQHRHHLPRSSVIDAKTFSTLGLETLKVHGVRMHAQKKPARCWAAAAAMLLSGREPTSGAAKTDHRGALVSTDENVKLFAGSLRWEYLGGHTKGDALLTKVLISPLWLGGENLNKHHTADAIHALVLAGMFAYVWQGRKWYLLKVFDPLPMGRGRIYFMEYDEPRLPGGQTFSLRWVLVPRTWIP